MSSSPLRRGFAMTGAAVILAALLSACSVPANLFSGDAQRDEAGSVTEESSIDIFKLKVGDCKLVDDQNSEQLSDTNVVPCDEPHDEEVYFEFDLPEGDYPAEDEIVAAAEEKCAAEFATFVGVAAEESALHYFYYWPTSQGWTELDDRLIQCVLYAEDESKLDASMKGAKA
ncbi:septum formation family protein [Microbacterium sp. NPDC058342]|uniref:septum formation family protein n=1 Tax=Microbacterium sp. NPDC058342 TaxID=3346454 RepID=UPI0036509481